MPRKPPVRANLFIAGAGKCGTTAWHAYLGTHPDIYFAEMKEPNYFLPEIPALRLVKTRRGYDKLFERGRSARYCGEASGYLLSESAPDEIRKYSPDAKILLFLRGQEFFLPAVHHQLLYRFWESIEDFETAWRASGARTPDTIASACGEPQLLDYRWWGDFNAQVGRFLDAFPPEQILITDFDYWTANPRAAYLRILDFLGLEDDGRTEFPRVNEAKTYRIKWLGRILSNPPLLVDLPVRLLRKLTGRSAMGLGAWASELIARRGYSTQVTPELREEIRAYFAPGNAALKKRLSKAGLVWN